MNERGTDNQIIEPTTFTRAAASEKKPLLTLNPVTIAISTLFVILTLAALFMFNAKAVQLNVLPQPDSISIKGALPGWELGGRYLMLRGTYQVIASAEGYENLETSIEVGEDAEQEFSFSLEKLPGIVTITTFFEDDEIEGAEIYIDQEAVGNSPVIVDAVKAGSRDLFVRHPRYLPVQTEILVEGKRLRQTETINLEPAWASIEVNSLPAGAAIIVDNEQLAVTPATVEVLQGDRQLILKLPGYKSWETRLDVVASEDQKPDAVVLIKSDGKISIDSEPQGVNITISGTYYGQTPLAVMIPPSERYELVATRAGYQSLTRTLNVEPEEDQSLNLRLKPVTGLVKLTVTPSGGRLFVDNQDRGDPSQTLELTARNHQIRVEVPGYADFETDVIPQPGFSQQLNIVMQTQEEARVSSIPQRLTTAQGDILRFILPGALKMGAGRREPGRRSNEIEKEILLTRSFYLGEKEVSNKSFKAFNPAHNSGVLGRALLSEDDRPVVNVSWDQAVRYCNWLSEQDGVEPAYEFKDGRWRLSQPVNTGYRLPTEAEWAWAARYADGPEPTRFPWGNNMPPQVGAGNFADESAASMVPYNIQGYNDKFRGPAPSGTYAPNSLGIFDLAGNVSEWMHDAYSIELARELLTDPTGPETGEYAVIRGSNYTHGRFSELRWTFRDYGSDPRPDVGFRIARYLE